MYTKCFAGSKIWSYNLVNDWMWVCRRRKRFWNGPHPTRFYPVAAAISQSSAWSSMLLCLRAFPSALEICFIYEQGNLEEPEMKASEASVSNRSKWIDALAALFNLLDNPRHIHRVLQKLPRNSLQQWPINSTPLWAFLSFPSLFVTFSCLEYFPRGLPK